MKPQNSKQGRPFLGRLFFILSMLFLTLGLWQASATGLIQWSSEWRQGGIWDIQTIEGGFVVASLYADKVIVRLNERQKEYDFAKPIRLFSDGKGGVLAVGMHSPRLGHIGPTGEWKGESYFAGQYVVSAALVEKEDAWLVGFRKGRADNRRKKHFYAPEYAVFKWFLMPFPDRIPRQRIHIGGLTSMVIYDHEEWHEESTGIWRMLANQDHLFVVNDLAESVNCLSKGNGALVWRASTPPRPSGAVIWGDRILVCSAQAGVVEAYRLDDGGRIWSRPFGRGLIDMALFFDKVALVDYVHDRLLLVDPLEGVLVKEVEIGGGPRAIAADGNTLLIGLTVADEVVRLDAAWREVERIKLSAKESS